MIAAEKLDALYDEVPPVGCKGLCHASCSHIPAGPAERARLAEHGFVLPDPGRVVEMAATGQDGTCPALSPLGRCRAYADRPMICRLFGATPALPCRYGCVADRPLGTRDTRSLLESAMAVEVDR